MTLVRECKKKVPHKIGLKHKILEYKTTKESSKDFEKSVATKN